MAGSGSRKKVERKQDVWERVAGDGGSGGGAESFLSTVHEQDHENRDGEELERRAPLPDGVHHRENECLAMFKSKATTVGAEAEAEAAMAQAALDALWVQAETILDDAWDEADQLQKRFDRLEALGLQQAKRDACMEAAVQLLLPKVEFLIKHMEAQMEMEELMDGQEESLGIPASSSPSLSLPFPSPFCAPSPAHSAAALRGAPRPRSSPPAPRPPASALRPPSHSSMKANAGDGERWGVERVAGVKGSLSSTRPVLKAPSPARTTRSPSRVSIRPPSKIPIQSPDTRTHACSKDRSPGASAPSHDGTGAKAPATTTKGHASANHTANGAFRVDPNNTARKPYGREKLLQSKSAINHEAHATCNALVVVQEETGEAESRATAQDLHQRNSDTTHSTDKRKSSGIIDGEDSQDARDASITGKFKDDYQLHIWESPSEGQKMALLGTEWGSSASIGSSPLRTCLYPKCPFEIPKNTPNKMLNVKPVTEIHPKEVTKRQYSSLGGVTAKLQMNKRNSEIELNSSPPYKENQTHTNTQKQNFCNFSTSKPNIPFTFIGKINPITKEVLSCKANSAVNSIREKKLRQRISSIELKRASQETRVETKNNIDSAERKIDDKYSKAIPENQTGTKVDTNNFIEPEANDKDQTLFSTNNNCLKNEIVAKEIVCSSKSNLKSFIQDKCNDRKDNTNVCTVNRKDIVRKQLKVTKSISSCKILPNMSRKNMCTLSNMNKTNIENVPLHQNTSIQFFSENKYKLLNNSHKLNKYNDKKSVSDYKPLPLSNEHESKAVIDCKSSSQVNCVQCKSESLRNGKYNDCSRNMVRKEISGKDVCGDLQLSTENDKNCLRSTNEVYNTTEERKVNAFDTAIDSIFLRIIYSNTTLRSPSGDISVNSLADIVNDKEQENEKVFSNSTAGMPQSPMIPFVSISGTNDINCIQIKSSKMTNEDELEEQSKINYCIHSDASSLSNAKKFSINSFSEEDNSYCAQNGIVSLINKQMDEPEKIVKKFQSDSKFQDIFCKQTTRGTDSVGLQTSEATLEIYSPISGAGTRYHKFSRDENTNIVSLESPVEKIETAFLNIDQSSESHNSKVSSVKSVDVATQASFERQPMEIVHTEKQSKEFTNSSTTLNAPQPNIPLKSHKNVPQHSPHGSIQNSVASQPKKVPQNPPKRNVFIKSRDKKNSKEGSKIDNSGIGGNRKDFAAKSQNRQNSFDVKETLTSRIRKQRNTEKRNLRDHEMPRAKRPFIPSGISIRTTKEVVSSNPNKIVHSSRREQAQHILSTLAENGLSQHEMKVETNDKDSNPVKIKDDGNKSHTSSIRKPETKNNVNYPNTTAENKRDRNPFLENKHHAKNASASKTIPPPKARAVSASSSRKPPLGARENSQFGAHIYKNSVRNIVESTKTASPPTTTTKLTGEYLREPNLKSNPQTGKTTNFIKRSLDIKRKSSEKSVSQRSEVNVSCAKDHLHSKRPATAPVVKRPTAVNCSIDVKGRQAPKLLSRPTLRANTKTNQQVSSALNSTPAERGASNSRSFKTSVGIKSPRLALGHPSRGPLSQGGINAKLQNSSCKRKCEVKGITRGNESQCFEKNRDATHQEATEAASSIIENLIEKCLDTSKTPSKASEAPLQKCISNSFMKP